VRLGTSAGTTRGFGTEEFRTVGALILRVLDALGQSGPEGDAEVEAAVLADVRQLCDAFPIYGGRA
jgi:glycine hydroxymethyltransferase